MTAKQVINTIKFANVNTDLFRQAMEIVRSKIMADEISRLLKESD